MLNSVGVLFWLMITVLFTIVGWLISHTIDGMLIATSIAILLGIVRMMID